MEARHHPKYAPSQCMDSARLLRPTELLAFQKKSRLRRLEAEFDEALEKALQSREAIKNLFDYLFYLIKRVIIYFSFILFIVFAPK